MIDVGYTVTAILLMGGVTFLIRAFPFIIFKDYTPAPILYLRSVLPYAIIAMLVVYCLKGIVITQNPHGIPELIAILAVVILHKWKRNTLLSISVGTVGYMVLVQYIFI